MAVALWRSRFVTWGETTLQLRCAGWDGRGEEGVTGRGGSRGEEEETTDEERRVQSLKGQRDGGSVAFTMKRQDTNDDKRGM